MGAKKALILRNEDPGSTLGSGLSQRASYRSRNSATLFRFLTKRRLPYQRLELVHRSVDISTIDSKNNSMGWSSNYSPCLSMRVTESLRFKDLGAAKVYVDV